MNIKVVRTMCGPVCTIGMLSINGKHICYTLEDVVRPDGKKIYGETAIPVGRYRVIVNFSNRFKRELPLVLDVPNFTGIRIHPGNTSADTHGCILVGQNIGPDRKSVVQSRAAFAVVFAEIRDAIRQGKTVWLEVDGNEPVAKP